MVGSDTKKDQIIQGPQMQNGALRFSKLNRTERIAFIENFIGESVADDLDSFLHLNTVQQSIFSELIENYLSNYFLPLGIIPNVVINDRTYLVPVVTEESSVIAAASRAAKFWASQKGFRVEVKSTIKKGQVHFMWHGPSGFLKTFFQTNKLRLLEATNEITDAMRNRGGGIVSLELRDKTSEMPDYFQLDVSFETADAMGANFINSCLERLSEALRQELQLYDEEGSVEIIMSILSNYTPDCLVTCSVECPVESLAPISGDYSPYEFARRVVLAVQIANIDISRAVTHNKGIFNGVDAVMLATGNDWRAVEAAGHSYASAEGHYRSLSSAKMVDDMFHFSLTIPMAVGAVGGLTNLHPLSAFVMKVLGNPTARELMGIAAVIGLANNFSAITSLVTTGIQKGHMKMHLSNILNQLGANEEQTLKAKDYFANKTISYSEVERFLKQAL